MSDIERKAFGVSTIMKIHAFCIAILLVVMIAMPAFAQSPSIANGLNWLSVNQNADGSWGTNASTTVIDATEVINAKINFGNDSSIQNAATWLTTQEVTTIDELSRKVSSLAYASTDTSSLISALINAKNLENGWGFKAGFSSSTLDTALAVQALRAANYQDQTILNQALAYLTGNQNADGGWGFASGDSSNIYLTAIVSATLQQFPQTTVVATAVSKAASYLLAQQNQDGSFGAASATYETALALISLLGSGQIADLPLQSAVNSLATTQTANGSWNDDPYSTALAIRALYLFENRPAPPPPSPFAGRFTGTVVDPITQQRVSGVAVALASNLLAKTVTDSAGSFTLPDVPSGQQKVVFSRSDYLSTSATATVIANVTVNLGNIFMASAYNTGTISGTIFDPNGAPLSGAAIAVSGSWSGSAVTAADGSFTFIYVTPGDVTITASKDGYQSFSGSGRVYARTTLSISPRLNAAPSQLATGTIIGRVVSDMWGYPIDHLPEEQGVRVTISGGAFAEPDPNNGGKFTISGLAPNTYQVTVGMSGFVSQTFRLIIAPGVTTDLGTIRLVMSASTVTLTGKVTDKFSGIPIPAAEIYIPETGQTGRSDFAGSYVIADIKATEFTVKTSATGYLAKTVALGSNGAAWTQVLDLSLTPKVAKGDLTGRVIDLSTGQPLAGATVALVSAPEVKTTSGSDGIFTLNSLSMGLQEITVSLNGYLNRTINTAIIPALLNETGDIALSASVQSAEVRGTIWDVATNSGFAGVRIRLSGTENREMLTAADGTYLFSNVAPGKTTIEVTPAGKPDYYPARISATLAEGGIFIYSPTLFSSLSNDISTTLQTDKPVYAKGETVLANVTLLNSESSELALAMRLLATAPDGTVIHDADFAATVAANGTQTITDSFQLPTTLAGGMYKAKAELYDGIGRLVGVSSANFGLAVSWITVSPSLPQTFATGMNAIAFNLANSGYIAVSNGQFAVAFKDPAGQTVASSEQPFSLGLGESKALIINLNLPPLPFGTYRLVYRQSDETSDKAAVEIPLVNSISMRATFDSSSHRVRTVSPLSVTIANSGNFAIDNGLMASVNVPDAGYSETKTLAGLSSKGAALVYNIPVPANMTAGEHNVMVTASPLAGNSTITTGARLVIFDANLAITPLPGTYEAGGMINHIISNNGGIDATAQYSLSLIDSKGAQITLKNGSETVLAGGSITIPLLIPGGAVDGDYNLVIVCKNLATGKEDMVTVPITISGTKGTLTVQTGKQSYLTTESISTMSSIINSGKELQSGNLHLQVTNAVGSRQLKTWTCQADFQQGVRDAIDTFETPDAITLLPYSDNFNDGVLNTDRWSLSVAPNGSLPVEQGGAVLLSLPWVAGGWYGSYATTKVPLAGDFDSMVDYSVVSPWQPASNNHPAGMLVSVGNWWARIDIWNSSPTYGSIDAYGSYTNKSWASTNGKFRIRRVGSTYYTYYWSGSSWVNMLNYGGRPTGSAYLQLMDFGPVGNSNVKFDNFLVTTQTYPASGAIYLKYDSTNSDAWDKFDFNADMPSGTAVKFRTRTAEAEAGLTTAAWSSYITVSGTPITSPKGRWIEVEATLSTTNTASTPVLRDISVSKGYVPGYIFWQTDVPVNLAQSAIADLNNIIGTIGAAGKYYLQGNLTSSTGQTVATAEYPFYIVQGNTAITLAPDKKLYKPGETVTISGEVRNLASIEAANLNLAIKSKAGASAEQTISSATFNIPAGGSRPFSVSTTAGAEGVVAISGTVTQNSAMLATIADQYEVAAPKLTAALQGPDSASIDPFMLTLTLVNSGKTDALITVAKSFSPLAESIIIPAGQIKNLQYQQQISADTSFTVNLSGDLTLQLKKAVAYIVPKLQAKLTAKVVTDKLSYSANEKVAVTTTINCLDAGTTGDTLAATVMVVGKNGEVLLSELFSLTAPESGRIYTSSRYWNSAAYPPGIYTARLTVEGGKVALATAESTFTILSSAATAAGITGTVAATVNPLYLGIDQTLNFTVVNSGNEDISSADLSIIVVNPDTMVTMQSYHKTVAIARQETITDIVTVPTVAYEERDYLAVLQITLPQMPQAKTLAGAPFAVKIAPPPQLQISTLPDRAITNNQTLNVTGSVTSVVAIKAVTIKGTDVAVNSDGSFSHALLLQAGENLISTVATDILGHSATDSRTIILDQTAPNLTIDTPADNSKTAISPIEVKGSVDETSIVTVKLNGIIQPVAMDGNLFSVSITPEPRWNTIEITATDLADNPSSQKRSVLFDDQKPSLSITQPDQDIRTNRSSITIGGKASDPYSAVGVTVAIDGAILTPQLTNDSFSQVVTFTDEKLYPIVVTASNEVGTQTTVQRNVIYDKTPPNLTIDPVVSPTNAASQAVSGTREEGRIVTVICISATAGQVEYPTATTWRALISGLSQGENRIQAETVDLAENRTTVAATILYVPRAPEVTISATPNQIWSPNKKLVPVSISGNVLTFGSEVKDLTISVADEYGKYNMQGLKFGDTIMLEAWRDGKDMDSRVYTITAVVTDLAGNRTTRSTTVIVPHDMGK